MSVATKDIFPKFRSKIKLSSRQDGDGNEVEVEVRENEEQQFKFQEIVNLLVAAGYFRARFKDLSPFDRVVGGMIWCIESCNVDIDVDFLFQENSTIGQKIALTEKIIAVFPKLKCPIALEPHQIQGLDFINIFPVIQWLVKRSMEFRKETFAFVRSNAIRQFNKSYQLPEDVETLNTINKISKNVKLVREAYRPQRQYKLRQLPPESEIERVEVTLLEYGFRGMLLDLKSKTKQEIPAELLEEQRINENRIEKLMKQMSITEMDDMECDFLDRDEIHRHYETLKSEMQDGGVKSREQQRLMLMKAQKQLLNERMNVLEDKTNEINSKIAQDAESLQEVRDNLKEATSRLSQIEENINTQNASDIEHLEHLLVIYENLREQENQFKEQCREELEQLQNMTESARQTIQDPVATDDLEDELQNVEKQVQVKRLLLAKQNRIIAAYQRQLDDIPSRAELAQYQRRFLELYNQIAAKHKETKQYFTLYNTLDDTKMYITKELSLLNSILDNYAEAMSSKTSKEEFLVQLENIVEGIKQTKAKVESRYKDEQLSRDNLNNKLQSLVAQQRKYVSIVRQLSIECRQNEALQAQKQNVKNS